MAISALKSGATEVKVRADGVVLHRHIKANDPEGKAWHPAKERHADAGTHARAKAEKPINVSILSEQQLRDYLDLNLKGLEPEWATRDWEAKKAIAKAKKAEREAAAVYQPGTAAISGEY